MGRKGGRDLLKVGAGGPDLELCLRLDFSRHKEWSGGSYVVVVPGSTVGGKGDEPRGGSANEQVSPEGTWGSVPLGSSRSQHGTRRRAGPTCGRNWGISIPTTICLQWSPAGWAGEPAPLRASSKKPLWEGSLEVGRQG